MCYVCHGSRDWIRWQGDVLRLDLSEGVYQIGFADDLILAVVTRKSDILKTRMNDALRRVHEWMESRNLRLAHNKG